MEEKITKKVEEVVDYIISKPAEDVTLNDYTILHEELKDIRFRKSQEAQSDRFKQIMAVGFPSGLYGLSE